MRFSCFSDTRPGPLDGVPCPDAVHFQPNRREPLQGSEEIRQDYRESTWIPFPDVYFELARALGQGDWLCIQGNFTGTHEGPLSGEDDDVIPPTHRSVNIPLCMVMRVKDGLFAEIHEYNDQLSLMAQLGLV